MDPQVPVVLELAPLPREQLGPFLILGIDKNADKEQIEAAWAQRVIAARKNQVGVPLEDVNWAREVVNDTDRRRRATVASLNLDTSAGVLADLTERFGAGTPRWTPHDDEKPLADYVPAIEVPAPDEVRAGITLPALPDDLPAVAWLLEKISQEPLDPWALPIATDPSQSP